MEDAALAFMSMSADLLAFCRWLQILNKSKLLLVTDFCYSYEKDIIFLFCFVLFCFVFFFFFAFHFSETTETFSGSPEMEISTGKSDFVPPPKNFPVDMPWYNMNESHSTSC